MATALFIKRSDIVKNTALNANVDTDKFIQWIKVAQDTHIQNYLGTDLLEKIQADIIAGSLAGNYLTLLTKYMILLYQTESLMNGLIIYQIKLEVDYLDQLTMIDL